MITIGSAGVPGVDDVELDVDVSSVELVSMEEVVREPELDSPLLMLDDGDMSCMDNVCSSITDLTPSVYGYVAVSSGLFCLMSFVPVSSETDVEDIRETSWDGCTPAVTGVRVMFEDMVSSTLISGMTLEPTITCSLEGRVGPCEGAGLTVSVSSIMGLEVSFRLESG